MIYAKATCLYIAVRVDAHFGYHENYNLQYICIHIGSVADFIFTSATNVKEELLLKSSDVTV